MGSNPSKITVPYDIRNFFFIFFWFFNETVCNGFIIMANGYDLMSHSYCGILNNKESLCNNGSIGIIFLIFSMFLLWRYKVRIRSFNTAEFFFKWCSLYFYIFPLLKLDSQCSTLAKRKIWYQDLHPHQQFIVLYYLIIRLLFTWQ